MVNRTSLRSGMSGIVVLGLAWAAGGCVLTPPSGGGGTTTTVGISTVPSTVVTTTTWQVTTTSSSTTSTPTSTTTTTTAPTWMSAGCIDSNVPFDNFNMAEADIEYNGLQDTRYNINGWFSWDGSCSQDPGYLATIVRSDDEGTANVKCHQLGLNDVAWNANTTRPGHAFPPDAWFCSDYPYLP